MTETTRRKIDDDESVAPVQQGCIDEHTCACGEKHAQNSGEISHREACTSPLKFGNSCCCQSDETAQNAPHRCGHGPRCH